MTDALTILNQAETRAFVRLTGEGRYPVSSRERRAAALYVQVWAPAFAEVTGGACD